MRSFKDSGGRDWTVAINVDALKRVRAHLGVDLTDVTAVELGPDGKPKPNGAPLIVRLTTDVMLLCDVLYCVCKPEADKAGVTDEDFGRAMGGESLLMGGNVLLEDLADFFQRLGRTEAKKIILAQQKVVRAAVAAAEKRLDSLNVEEVVEQVMLDAERSMPGSLSTSVPGSSA